MYPATVNSRAFLTTYLASPVGISSIPDSLSYIINMVINPMIMRLEWSPRYCLKTGGIGLGVNIVNSLRNPSINPANISIMASSIGGLGLISIG